MKTERIRNRLFGALIIICALFLIGAGVQSQQTTPTVTPDEQTQFTKVFAEQAQAAKGWQEISNGCIARQAQLEAAQARTAAVVNGIMADHKLSRKEWTADVDAKNQLIFKPAEQARTPGQ